jgi:hypothetical protein
LAPPAGAGEGFVVSAEAPDRLTTITLPHFLQRTLTPLGPILSSEIMYCALHLSHVNFMGSTSA